MPNAWQKCLEKATIQAAFVAIASRIVGSAFRCLETFNPQYKQSNVGTDPKTVCIRELSTIGMAWGFALVTNALISDRLKARHWSQAKIQFLTSVIGTVIAESAGRLIAYRKLYRSKADFLTPLPSQVAGVNSLQASASQVVFSPASSNLPQPRPYAGYSAMNPFR